MIQEDITLVLIIKNNVSLNFIYYQNIELYKNIFPPIISSLEAIFSMIDIKQLPPRNTSFTGEIIKHEKNHYTVVNEGVVYCCCRTFEQAYYVRQELNKCNWDKDCLKRILEDYPLYYTDLMDLYRYVTIYNKSNLKWCVSIPSYKSDNGINQQIRCSKIEDALYERDFLLENNWDYELLIYTIDDTNNPYYDVELPPYPERKIRNIRVPNNHKQELTQVYEWLKETPNMTQKEICQRLGVSDMTIRNWFKKYDTTWKEYKRLILEGINPLDVLKFKKHVYKPNLLPVVPKREEFIREVVWNMKNPYIVKHNNVSYGCYPTKELAEKVVEELQDNDWDKKQLPSIWRKLNCFTDTMVSPFRKNYVYTTRNGSFSVRKTINGKFITFGTFEDYSMACRLRDILLEINWDTSLIDEVTMKVMNEYKKGDV